MAINPLMSNSVVMYITSYDYTVFGGESMFYFKSVFMIQNVSSFHPINVTRSGLFVLYMYHLRIMLHSC